MNVFLIPRGDFWCELSKGASPAGAAPAHVLRSSSVPRGTPRHWAGKMLSFLQLWVLLDSNFISLSGLHGGRMVMKGSTGEEAPGELRKSASGQGRFR